MSASESWTVREKLSLAVAVAIYGITNWDRAIRTLKIMYGDDYHMFSGNSCDVQYCTWLDRLDVKKHLNADPDQVIDPSYLIIKELELGQDLLTIMQLEQDLWEQLSTVSVEVPINRTFKTVNLQDRDDNKWKPNWKKVLLLVHKELEEHKHGYLFSNRCSNITNRPLNMLDIKRRIKANEYRCSNDFLRDVESMCKQLFNYHDHAGGGRGQKFLHLINEFQHFSKNLIRDRLT